MASPGTARRQRLPRHPSQIAFDTLGWQAPLGVPYRHVLSNGTHAYIASDSTLPLVTLLGHMRYGTLSDPKGKEGLSHLLGQLLRSGGVQGIPADTLDMLLDLFAIKLSFSMYEDRLQFTASFLSQFVDTALGLLRRVLYEPTFEEARLERERDALLENVRHRFDNPGPILTAAYRKAMYAGKPNNRLATEQSAFAITRDDLLALHQGIVSRGIPLVAAAGMFDAGDMKRRLEALLARADSGATAPPFPQIAFERPNRVLVVHKPITQAYVRLALPMVKRPHPDYYPLSVLDYILGGGSFSSRLNTVVRSDAGLSYSIYSRVESNYTYRGAFRVTFHTKTESVVDATRLVLAEMRRIRADGVTEEEVAKAKDALVDALPSMFRSKTDLVDHYSWNEYYGRSDEHFREYAGKIRAIGVEQVVAMARKYLDPDSLTYVVVTDTAGLYACDTAAEFSLRGLAPFTVVGTDSLAFLP
jgi:zinc protease